MSRWLFWTIQAFGIGMNLAIGAWHIHHHRTGMSCINLACAGLIFGVNILTVKARRRHREVMAELEQQHAAALFGLEQLMMGEDVIAKAQTNLGKVARALSVTTNGDTWFLTSGRFVFAVGAQSVHKLGKEDMQPIASTCIQSGGLPAAEVIASLLLLLHHNPGLFDLWAQQDGRNYGA